MNQDIIQQDQEEENLRVTTRSSFDMANEAAYPGTHRNLFEKNKNDQNKNEEPSSPLLPAVQNVV